MVDPETEKGVKMKSIFAAIAGLFKPDPTIEMVTQSLKEIHRENLDNMQRIAVMRERFEALMNSDTPDFALRSEIARILKETDYE